MLAPSDGILIIDGFCQVLVNPLVLAIITVTFDQKERPKAIMIYGVASVGIMESFPSLINSIF